MLKQQVYSETIIIVFLHWYLLSTFWDTEQLSHMVSLALAFVTDAYFVQTCIYFWQIDVIMQISTKNITFMLGNEREKLSPASVNVVNWVAELIQLKTGSRKNKKILL